ncbi:hypothetical protein GPN2_13533 [Streptomyces murinus]
MTATFGCGRRGGSRPLGFQFSLADGARERMRTHAHVGPN